MKENVIVSLVMNLIRIAKTEASIFAELVSVIISSLKKHIKSMKSWGVLLIIIGVMCALYIGDIGANAADATAPSIGESVIIVTFFISIYFFPTLVAFLREKNNTTAILILNLFLGWTFVGWVIALVWATTKNNS